MAVFQDTILDNTKAAPKDCPRKFYCFFVNTTFSAYAKKT
ncbi:hypothetical protein HMPREF9554_00480 [Treponema phagedenis F0421]|nr:hypothetical protein HMPREF9554_00480 [Treponema phagedenis F0421]